MRRRCVKCRHTYSVSADRPRDGVYICQDCAERDLAKIQHRKPRLIYRHGLATVILKEEANEQKD